MSKSKPPFLTDKELEALNITADLSNQIFALIGNGPQRKNDWNEAAMHIHSLQHMIMAQAAARLYPEMFRLLGEKFE